MQSIGALQSQLYNAVYGQDSIINGGIISSLIAELEKRSDEIHTEDLNACRAVVEKWYGMWFPTDDTA